MDQVGTEYRKETRFPRTDNNIHYLHMKRDYKKFNIVDKKTRSTIQCVTWYIIEFKKEQDYN